MTAYLHPEKDWQVWVVEEYEEQNPGTRYLIEFGDGESHAGFFFSAGDGDNAGELEIEMDDPRYDEFHQVVYEVESVESGGHRLFDRYLTIDYRDFPVRVTDLDAGVVVYSERSMD